MNPDNLQILGIEISRDDAQLFKDWMSDKRGRFLRRWLEQQSKLHHDRASMPIGANAIADVIASQRNLASETAFDLVLNFEESFNECLKDEKLVDEKKK